MVTSSIIGMQELLYDEMPRGTKSMGAAAYTSGLGMGSFISSVIVSMVQGLGNKYGEKWLGNNMNSAHLYSFYWVLAGLSGLNFCVFLWVARSFVYKKVEAREESELSLREYLDGET